MTIAEQRVAMQAATVVVQARARGDRVLVTCMQGRNRSGLIAALALRRLGVSADDAVSMVRSARGIGALNNAHFLALLRAATPLSAMA
jgi:protein-tyrosine phosphatase